MKLPQVHSNQFEGVFCGGFSSQTLLDQINDSSDAPQRLKLGYKQLANCYE
ncbi:hypothetical protein [Crocosphaera sp. XPORK-15E]|uniref:hypothetical protein n=1 Tax=Crocosphaera sp. XPORK-15E TaxID=3110247 RepID=UPI002B2079F4|nr:hypothetical protein [Crocosphaera sp. XPORK-15E]MEA5532851.1 hypothetical protein [Crocosphaera sp. XPORK-15E]